MSLLEDQGWEDWGLFVSVITETGIKRICVRVRNDMVVMVVVLGLCFHPNSRLGAYSIPHTMHPGVRSVPVDDHRQTLLMSGGRFRCGAEQPGTQHVWIKWLWCREPVWRRWR